ncbi:MAG TPA: polysaccharide deacetylase family protein [Methyloceanibacter sp.]|nr:polysaccharide deacetylase family protein [Methyloceanibacter sp.]
MSRISIIAVVLWSLAGSAAVHAEEPQTRQQCWTPQALAGTGTELKDVHDHKSLDLAPLKQVTLAPPTPIAPSHRGSIRGVELPPDKKLIALTFDLCEENGYVSGYDGRIVDLLRAQGIKATFFAGGKWMETHPERTQQLIADPLFEIGSHGLRHLDLSHANAATLAEEITLTEAAYDRAKTALASRQCLVGAAPPAPPARLTLLRFPYGRCNDQALAAAADAGVLSVQWDLVTGDPDPRVPAKTIANRILTKVHPGAIVVAHANGRGHNTAAALAIALPKLKEQGYSFVTVSELIAAGKPVIATRCYQNNPGDMTRIARSSVRRGSHDLYSIFGPAN